MPFIFLGIQQRRQAVPFGPLWLPLRGTSEEKERAKPFPSNATISQCVPGNAGDFILLWPKHLWQRLALGHRVMKIVFFAIFMFYVLY